MPEMIFNPSLTVCQNLFALFLERNPGYDGPTEGPEALEKCREVVRQVMKEKIQGLKRRQALASVDDSNTEL